MPHSLKVELKTTQEIFSKLFSWLLEKEAENNLLISALLYESKKLNLSAKESLVPWALVSDTQNIPLQLIYRSSDGTLIIGGENIGNYSPVINLLLSSNTRIKSIMGPTPLAADFTKELMASAKLKKSHSEEQVLLSLNHNPIKKITISGNLINPNIDDLPLLVDWYQNFSRETVSDMDSIETAKQILRYGIKNRSLYIWKDQVPRSMAFISGESPNGCRISMVYTPNEFRRQNYSYCLLLKLAELIIGERKKKFCLLFANEKDQAAKSLYKKVGFTKIISFQKNQFILA